MYVYAYVSVYTYAYVIMYISLCLYHMYICMYIYIYSIYRERERVCVCVTYIHVHMDMHIVVESCRHSYAYASRDHHHVGGRGDHQTLGHITMLMLHMIVIYVYRLCSCAVCTTKLPQHSFSADCRTSQLLVSNSMPHSKIARSTPQNHIYIYIYIYNYIYIYIISYHIYIIS